MTINEQTKIAALLKHHPDALEAIVSLSPDFKKLRNPVLRRLMAGRTSIGMASKIGGCTPDDFFRVLAPLGFVSDVSSGESEELPVRKPRPDYLRNISPERLIQFDVREMLAEGTDPLKMIQEKVKALNPGEVLTIVNTFEPVPLIRLLERKGFETWVNAIDEETIETYFFRKVEVEAPEEVADDIPETAGDWDSLVNRFKNRLEEIDVREMEMPGPMMTILEKLEVLTPDKALFVHHKRIPVFLLTELKDRQFDYRIREVGEGEVHLMIFRQMD